MTELNKFYNEACLPTTLIDFADLSVNQKEALDNTLAFSMWKLAKAADEAKAAVDKWANSYLMYEIKTIKDDLKNPNR